MPLERLTPLVTKYDLGSLRLWQDELTEIVRLVRQLPGVHVRIESDSNLVTDVVADLPQLGQRVSYFSVTARRLGAGEADPGPSNVISVKLAKDECLIEATEPDLTTLGLVEAIRSLAGSCRRLPMWLTKSLYRAVPAASGGSIALFPVVGICTGLVVGVIFGVGAVQHLVHSRGTPAVAWPESISVAIPVLVLVAALWLGLARARTLLFTATRQDAPTFWQRKRSDIAINVIVGVVFYLLGLLTAHL